MSNVVLSLDGRKEINDLKRVDYAGNGSYDIIVPKFKKIYNFLQMHPEEKLKIEEQEKVDHLEKFFE